MPSRGGRKKKHGELLSKDIAIKVTPTLYQKVLRASKDLSSYGREALQEKVERDEGRGSMDVPLKGYIAAGPGVPICPLPEGAFVRPPFALPPRAFALVVVGESMQGEFGMYIPNGSYAFFDPDGFASFRMIVHVEFPANPDIDDGEREASLKEYHPRPDGSAEFVSLNKAFKPFVKKKGEFEVVATFLRAWDGSGDGEDFYLYEEDADAEETSDEEAEAAVMA